MISRLFAGLWLCLLSLPALAEGHAELRLELNKIEDVNSACRLTFVADNNTGPEIEKAVFETVIFDAEGGVMRLSLFDFRSLPQGRPRVRQFDLPETACADLGQVLINGANVCLVAGAQSDICADSLMLNSRIEVDLLG